MRTPQFEEFIAPARHYPQIWRIIVGILALFGAYIIPIMVGFVLVGIFLPAAAFNLQLALSEPVTPAAMFILLGTFLFMGLGAVAAAAVHRRGLASLIGPFRPACRNFTRSVGLCLLIFLISGAAVSLIFPDAPLPNMPLTTWLSYLPLALPLLLIQTGAEELVFRGYLMQQLAARFKSPIVWMGIPTVLFGLAHTDPTIDPKLTVLIICATGLFGLAAADLTRVTGNLGAAIGFHFTNNFFALFLVSIAGEMSGLSLYLAPFTMDDVDTLMPLMAVDMVVVVITWMLLRRWLRPAG
ncbi:type II CAAX endopeptidase family protein [uncultured Litoreibacter sp.]|uniref:CPBP family intramembrane glutamic endopeptidase n=1 Tax=uncultured Litoreibacter sp. TaxID=1392394 RepID=UPI002638FA81|nr:type II CAAX endopeptidase family protein [uncultured Litoreibacter sp.]